MRVVVVLACFILICNSPLRAQDSLRFERAAYVVGATAAFSLFDYFGYYLIYEKGIHTPYRLLQSAVQAGISYLLYEKFGLPSAIAFNLMWWSWCDDFGFYAWADIINPPGPWANRADNQMQYNNINWAGWTPVGLMRPQGSVISRDVLITQALTGFVVSMSILW